MRRNDQNLTIGVLSITAVILLVGVILTTFGGNTPAHAIGQIDRGGDYIIVTGQFTENTELVYITDAAAKRLNAYSYETSTRQLVLWDALDLRQIFEIADGNAGKKR